MPPKSCKAWPRQGEFTGELGELKVRVTVDKEARKITVSDHGLGMTADEIKKYINQIAFSGATEFVEKYKETDAQAKDQIIGAVRPGFLLRLHGGEGGRNLVEIVQRRHANRALDLRRQHAVYSG